MKPGTRVIFNTGILYVKLLVGMALGLFTTRLVLAALGETDYGIFSLVAGVIGILSILNSSMSRASMRFMAHSLGTGNEEIIKKTFNTTLFLHFIIGTCVLILMEIAGILMFEHLLEIPVAKIQDAKIIFHFMVVTTFVSIVSVPYDAVMNSHENLLALSLADIFGYVLKLGIAIYLTYSAANLLVLYGGLMLVAQIIIRIIKQWYSRVRYLECKINFRDYLDKKLSKEIFFFSGWNLFGSIASISITQVRSILLNMFFGVSLNAADGISKTASSQVNSVSASMTRALNPQLVKTEGSGDRQKMLHITELATKFSVFLFALVAIPVLLETSFLLNIWLKTVPEFAIIFCQLILISLFIDKFTFEINTAVNAAGRIRNFNIAASILALLNIPIAYLVFKAGFPPYSIFGVNIFIGILGIFMRFYFGKKLIGLNILQFIKNGIIPSILPVIVSITLSLLPIIYLKESFFRFIITTLSSLLVLTITFWFIGLTNNEKHRMRSITQSVKNRIGF